MGASLTLRLLKCAPQNGVGIAAATLSPALSYEIGQYFKAIAEENKRTGKTQEAELTTGQQTAHILAHAVLGAATAAAGEHNALAGAISAGGAEAAAPVIGKWLYGKDKGSDLTAEEKETVTVITNLLGTATGGAVGNSTANAVQGSLNAQSAVKNNSQLFDDLRDWTKEKAETAATAARELFPNTPAISGFLLGLGDVANGGLGLTDAAAESLAMAIHCVSGLDYCNTAITNNQERGRILLDTARAVTDGRIKNALEHWGNNLLYGTSEQQRQATEQLARVSTALGIGTAVSSPKVDPIARPIATNASKAVPITLTKPVIQSRINLKNRNFNDSGWLHVIERHFPEGRGSGSQFSISKTELRELLQHKDVVSVPITKVRTSIEKLDDGTRIPHEIYERVVRKILGMINIITINLPIL
ncbi:hypothetical protein EGK75_13210 [Neisseria weixii]|uniref:VENN motif-containing domain-containing protein n=1 Tax=Neisseria weixii TaxID=1853276 RepID=A0A3N4MVG0_9NEIS|nr:VENN motif pre-toxin domain-containing protein [Neisseria weixii]RPD83179.1 hypothetical protein EGK74_13215 [Neisseria weixii]RPD83409.1 hypothetical protein EGK75_13210 [Neisseria weixii]